MPCAAQRSCPISASVTGARLNSLTERLSRRAFSTDLPPSYLAAALAYSLGYSAVAMLVALLLFEDRDLA